MVQVSDHAVLRFLERVRGIDVEAVRAEMRCQAVKVADQFGCATVKRADGFRLILRNGSVVTVLPPMRNYDPWKFTG